MSEEQIEMNADFIQKLTMLYKKPDLKYPALENIYDDIYALSFLFYKTKEPIYLQKMLEICLEDGAENNLLDVWQENFVYWQCISNIFRNNCSNNSLDFLLRKVFQKQVGTFQNMLPKKYNFIPKEQRNKKTVAVITSQFLSIEHSPSNVALNICAELNQEMGMEVCLINSAECMSSVGKIDMYNTASANFTKDFNDIGVFKYKDTPINFYQCRQPMPNLGEIALVLDFVAQLKPYFIVNLGGSNITADLCGTIVPVITRPTITNSLPFSGSQFLILIGRKLNAYDDIFLDIFNRNRDNVLDNVVSFSFDILESTNVYARSQFKIPEDKFIVAIVGNRLDSDISEEVMSFFRELLKNDKIHIVIIGNFAKYADYCDKYADFSAHSTYLGYQGDFAGVIALCDLFVNPKRPGNGTSVIYAMLKGLPVVTFNHNDVAIRVNDEEFYVNTYDEMKNVIYRYASDRQFYNAMSERVRKIIGELIDKKKGIKQIIDKMLESSMFI